MSGFSAILKRVQRLEAAREKYRPPDFVYGAMLTEIEPGVFQFDIPEQLAGRQVKRAELDAMQIPLVLIDYMDGPMRGEINE